MTSKQTVFKIPSRTNYMRIHITYLILPPTAQIQQCRLYVRDGESVLQASVTVTLDENTHIRNTAGNTASVTTFPVLTPMMPFVEVTYIKKW